MRFTLPKLFLAVTLAAIACAGLTLRTRTWADAIVTLSVAMFAITALLAFTGRRQSCPFRAAFAIVGGGYLLLIMCTAFSPLRDSLLTSRALVLAAKSLRISTTNLPGQFTLGAVQITTPQTAVVASSPASVTGGSLTLNTSPAITSGDFTPAMPVGSIAAAVPTAGATLVTASPYINNNFQSNATFNVTLPEPDSYENLLDTGLPRFDTSIPAVAFLVIGHCVWSWFLALLAGCLAAYSLGKREKLREEAR